MKFILLKEEYSSDNYIFIDQNSKLAKQLSKNYDEYLRNMDSYKKQNVEFAVDKLNNTIIGMVCIGKTKDTGFISNVDVDSKYRRQGIGTKLVKDAISKYGGIDLTVDKDNYGAIKLYKNLGFVIIGEAGDDPPGWWMKLKSKLDKDGELP